RSRWKDEALARGVVYELRVEPAPLPAVAADPSELREVLINLVLNALDAMPEGGPIVLRTRVAGDTVVCEVTDRRIGMSGGGRPRVCDPSPPPEAERGPGLGRGGGEGIPPRHGGDIEVRSEPGEGSTFMIRLPAARVVAEPPPHRVRARPGPAVRVLVIDDE